LLLREIVHWKTYFGAFKERFFNLTPEKFNYKSGSYLIKTVFELDDYGYS